MATAVSFAKGEKLLWLTSQGHTRGTVVRKAGRGFKIRGFRITASADNPKIVVKSETSGEIAARKPGALKKLKR